MHNVGEHLVVVVAALAETGGASGHAVDRCEKRPCGVAETSVAEVDEDAGVYIARLAACDVQPEDDDPACRIRGTLRKMAG